MFRLVRGPRLDLLGDEAKVVSDDERYHPVRLSVIVLLPGSPLVGDDLRVRRDTDVVCSKPAVESQ